MEDEWLRQTARPLRPPRIDVNTPNVARVWNFLQGGKDNFDADRKAARQLIKAAPVMEYAARATRDFLRRTVCHLAGEAGIRQFLDVGTGIPISGNVHEIAQETEPACRVVYVDNDPVVLSHARALLQPGPGGTTSFVDADARNPELIIRRARDTLDFSQPVGIVLTDLLNLVSRDAEARTIVSALLDAACRGSYMVVMHPASDIDAELADAARRWNKVATLPVTLRRKDEIAAWFTGLDVIEPGIVPVTQWRPGPDDGEYSPDMPLYGLVAREPLPR
ncbi:MAG TPA: SAM-dependent methyltransferase [Trebonia sp.]